MAALLGLHGAKAHPDDLIVKLLEPGARVEMQLRVGIEDPHALALAETVRGDICVRPQTD